MASDYLSVISPNYQQAAKAAATAAAKAQNPDPEFAKKMLQEMYGAQPLPVANTPAANNVTPTVADNVTTPPAAPLTITVHPEPEQEAASSLSPYQQRQEKPYDVVNNDFFGTDSLKAALDTVNPLQQLPVISTAYRELTGDTISTGSRLVGGALLGGPVGFALALVNEIVSGVTGKDIGANLYAAVSDKYKATEQLS